MIEMRSTYSVTVKFGKIKLNSEGFRVLADNILQATEIINDWVEQQGYDDDWEITNILLTGGILARIEETND